MTDINHELEREVSAIRALSRKCGAKGRATGQAALQRDRHFCALTDLLASRIAYLVRRYGLTDMREDAEQACAIAVHRAVEEFDGRKASFSTFVTWKLRGELQALRHRTRLDQRPGAQRIAARTVSLEGSEDSSGGEVLGIADEEAQKRTESGASDMMARRLADSLIQDYIARRRLGRPDGEKLPPKPGTVAPNKADELEAKLRRESQIVSSHLLGVPDTGDDGSLSNEQKRQVTRRVLRHVTKQLRGDARYEAARATLH
ncbi:MAG: sigma factor [Alteripontixanthobacter sp.]